MVLWQRRDGRLFQRIGCALATVTIPLLLCGLTHAQGSTSSSANIDDIATTLQRRPPQQAAQSAVTPAPEDFYKVQLVPGSLLSMDVFGIPELSGVMLRIDVDGNVSVPTLGPVRIQGNTVLQAQETIAKALVAGEILIDPIVRLNVVQFAAEYVSVLGEVQNPGRFQLIARRSLGDVLALAGGETLSAGDDIEIQHAGPDAQMHSQHVAYTQRDPLTVLQGVEVTPGDSIFVRRAGTVYVLGAVNRPGGYLMVSGGKLNVYQAISLAGGSTLDAAKNGIYIIRPQGESFETIKLPFSKLVRDRQSEIQLQLNDVLYIPRSGWKVALLDGSAIIGAAVNGAIYTAR